MFDTIGRVYELAGQANMSVCRYVSEAGLSYSSFKKTAERKGQLRLESIEKITEAHNMKLGEFFQHSAEVKHEREQRE